jgi:hypothetical protein
MVTFGGWVDAVLAYSDDDSTSPAPGAGEKDPEAGSLRFSGAASIKTMVKVTDSLEAKINLWFDPGNASNNLNMREAYWNWGFSEGLSWQMGKYIDHVGLISAEPTGPTFLFINASLIGYTATYGNDVLGTALNIAPKGSSFSGSVHVTNGYYTSTDGNSSGYVSTPSGARENTDLGLGLDLSFELADGLGSINAEMAYDMHSGSQAYTTFNPGFAGFTGMGGDVLMFGANTFLKPTKIVKVGAEVMYLTLEDSQTALGVDNTDGVDRLQFLVMGNVEIEGAPIPMSVTGMIQYVQVEYNFANAETESRIGASVALMTNPLTTTKFGLNYEIGYFTKENTNGVNDNGTNNVSGFALSVEGIVEF